jgi:hypothetical protein
MSDLHRALGDISSIRRQVASSTEFRGYGPATLAATSAFALITAVLQASFVASPELTPTAYLTLWIGTAALAGGVTGVSMFTRSRRMHSGMSDEMIGMAAQQFLPAVASGSLLTLVLLQCVPHILWMLPGLWQIIYSLGIFASCRFMPKPMLAAAAWYLITGLGCLALGDARSLSPWAMGFPFVAGQMLVAAVLYWSHPAESHEI